MNSECSEILSDRFDLTVAQFQQLMPLKQLILQDAVDCAMENLCPVRGLNPIIGKEAKCIDGVATEINYPCKKIDLLSYIPLHQLGSSTNASGAGMSPFIIVE